MKKYCSCGKLININETCSKCTKARHKEYNKKRDKNTNKFYNSTSWTKLRDYIRVRDKGLCLMCLNQGKIEAMRVVHHITPYEDDESLRLDENNLVCLCQRCHEEVHERYKEDKEHMQERLRGLVGLV